MDGPGLGPVQELVDNVIVMFWKMMFIAALVKVAIYAGSSFLSGRIRRYR